MYTDEHGIVRFEATDDITPLETRLNVALQSVSDRTYSSIERGHRKLDLDGSTLRYNVGSGHAFLDLYNAGENNYTLVRSYNGDEHAGQLYFTAAGDIQLNAGGSASNATSSALYVRKSQALPLAFRQLGNSTIIPVPRIASGRVNITPTANSPSFVTVTFPSGRFTSTPDVTATAVTSVPGTTVLGVSTSSTTTTSTRIYLTRTNTTTTSIEWIAVQS